MVFLQGSSQLLSVLFLCVSLTKNTKSLDQSDIQFLKEIYASARNKYKPSQIKALLVAEAPPNALDRYFYFEDVPTKDSLFLEIMGVLYPAQKAAYLKAGRDAAQKAELLSRFQHDGWWLLNFSEVPLDLTNETLEALLSSFLQRLGKYIDKKTPVFLIKAALHDLCYPALLAEGYHACKERLPFPGSGQQRVFRMKFKKAVENI